MLDSFRIVLARPLYGGNVGSVCRAMMNMGLSRLRIVPGPLPLFEEEIRKMALDAFSLYERREEFGSTAEAIADCVQVAGTTARTGFYRDHARPIREWVPRLMEASRSGPVALLFGPEDKGLTTEELGMCTQVVQIPSSESFPALNLAQAVMVCAYELFVAAGSFEPAQERFPEATSEQRERMFEAWREALLAIGFMKEDKADHMMLGLRRILSRGPLTEADVRILMGMARQSSWVAQEKERWKQQSSGRDGSVGDPPCS